MNYDNFKKEELITKLQEQEHAFAAIAAKDTEIAKLLIQLAESKATTTAELTAKHATEITKLQDSLAASQNQIYKITQQRVADLNVVLLAHGDLLKTLQGVTDTHMKLNTLIVKDLSGGTE